RVQSRVNALASPPWVKAPVLLVRYPGLLLAVAGSVLILVVASPCGPLFLSSAGNAALRNGIAASCSWDVALQVSDTNPLAGSTQFGSSESLLQGKEQAIALAARTTPDLQ